MLLGLIPTVSVYPGQTLPTGLVGLTLILPVALWGRFKVGLPHLLFCLFAVYAITSAIWSVGQWAYGLWILMSFAIGLVIGSRMDQRPVWVGIAIGLGISSSLALAHSLGFQFIYSHSETPAGLYFNPSLHGWVMALGIVGFICVGMKWWSILLIPGLYLSNSRGAWALVAFGIIAYFIRKPFILLTATLVAASWVASSLYVNEIQRLEIWRYAINLMVWTGHGVGSFAELWYHDNARLWKPEYVHNDYLQLIFEYGIGVVPLFAVGFWLAMQKSSAMWPLYITCCICACFAFPFYTPITAFIWALACGGIIRKSHGTP